MRIEYFAVYLSVGLATLGNVVSYKMAAILGTPHTFSEFSSMRRYASFLVPVLLVGGGVSLPLAISRLQGSGREKRGVSQLYSHVLVALGAGMLAALTWVIAAHWIAPAGKWIGCAVVALATTSSLTGLTYAYFRGLQSFLAGSVILTIANGVGPMLAAAFLSMGLAASCLAWSALNLGIVIVVALRLPRPTCAGLIRWRQIALGSGRSLGDVAFALLFLIPVVQYHAVNDAVEESVFNYGMVLLGLLIAVATPIGIVLLPVVGGARVRGDREVVTNYFGGVLIVAAVLGLGFAVALGFFADELVTLLLAPEFATASELLKSFGLAGAGLAFFVLLKSVIDGLQDFPITALISVIALAVYVIADLLGPDEAASRTEIATVVSFCSLGLMAILVAVGLTSFAWRQEVRE